jgi:tripartite-type tricarboxylate transporter receptor subunit TctC
MLMLKSEVRARGRLLHSMIAAATAAVAITAFVPRSFAADSAADFYKGKTVFMLAGVSAGGDVDFKMRLLARYIGRYIPGKPTVVPQNMVGATGLLMANYLYRIAVQDGTYIGLVQNGLPAYQTVGMPGVQFETAKFNWIGSMAPSNQTMAVWKTAGVNTIEDAKTKELPTAAIGAAGVSTSFPLLLNALLGTKFKVIPGYTGAGDANLAMERGEVSARGGPWQAWKTNNATWLRNRDIIILTYSGPAVADLANVPQLKSLVRSEEDRELISLVTSGDDFGQPFATGPNVSADRVELLRKAFAETMTDPDLVKEAAAVDSEIKPISGEDLQQIARSLGNIPQPIRARARTLMGN